MLQLGTALSPFREDTGKAWDAIGPGFIKHLPKEGREELLQVLQAAEDRASWGWQMMAVTVALMPKPSGGGERPIALVTFLVRLWMRMRRCVGAAWTNEHRAEWDAALAGSSAIQAALGRALSIESARERGMAWGVLLLDIEKFYDSIPIPVLIREALMQGYPATMLYMGVTQCLAARHLRIGPCSSRETLPTSSILAGLGESNNFARIVLHGAQPPSRHRHLRG